MATTVNDPGQWRIVWDSSPTDMFNMFPDGCVPFQSPMPVSENNAFWDLPGPGPGPGPGAGAASCDVPMQRTYSNLSQVSDDYPYIGRHQSNSPLAPELDPSRQTDYDTSISHETDEASPQTDGTSTSTRKRKSATPDTSVDSSPRTKSRRDRERNRVAAAKCRQKAKQSVSELQDRERELLQQNRFLTAHAGSLREEVINLKNEILRHSQCDSDFTPTPSNMNLRT